MKVISTGSARGLSLSAYVGLGIGADVKLIDDSFQVLETMSYAISLAYASRNAFPFSTYGENLFLTFQNVTITLLILYFSAPRGAVLNGPYASQRPLTGTAGRNSVTKVVAGLAIAVVSGLVLSSENLCPPGAREAIPFRR